MKNLTAIAIFLVSMLVSLSVFMGRFESEQKRSLASMKSKYDLSCTPDENLNQAIAERIVNGLKIERRDTLLGIHIGHFVTFENRADKEHFCKSGQERGISSHYPVPQKKTACQMYPKLLVGFEADGQAANGDKRALEVELPCSVSGDLNHTDLAWIPWAQIATESPFEGVTQYSKPSPVSITIRNVSDEWPSKWILSSISYVGTHDRIVVNREEIEGIAKRPFVLEFK